MKKVALVIPVYNEEKVLEDSITKLIKYFKENIKYDWKIVIANNASKDKTEMIANNLSKKFKQVKAIHLTVKGRGNALKKAWTKYSADCYSYCDVDLATDISGLKELFESIIEEKCDIAIGNRYLENSNTKRNIGRLIYSKIYIYIVRILFKTKLTDFQCGFKAVNKRVIKNIISEIKNNEWFFDTELLLRAENAGYKIKQIPVKWNEMRAKESKVNIINAGFEYVKEIAKLRWELRKKQ